MSDLLTRLDAMKATERKLAAIAAYDDACEHPDCVNWETIAHALRRVLPNPRKIPANDDAGDIGGNGFAPWFELKKRPTGGSGKDWGSVRAEITFADGRTVRAYAMTFKGSAPDIAGACRAACDLWRYKTQAPGLEWRARVPEIVSVCIPETGATYQADTATAYTSECRAPECKPDLPPSLEAIRRRARECLDWFTNPESGAMPHRDTEQGRAYAQARIEHTWQDIAPEACPISEAMPEPVEIEPEAMPEAMPEIAQEQAPEPVKPRSDLARRLMASALARPLADPVCTPCAIMVKPPRVPMALAA